MRTLSANLKAHLQGDTLTICTLWKIVRADAQVFGFTDHTRDIDSVGVIYKAATGHTPSSIKTTSNLAVDNLEVQSVLDSETITEPDIQAGIWDYAEVTISIINYNSLGDGHMMMRSGWLGNIKTGRSNFIAELRGMTQPLQQTIGRGYAPACDAVLGDARCGVALASYTVAGEVTSVTSGRIFTDTARTEANGYYDGGLVTWTSGDNDTYRMEVKTSTSAGVITLQQFMPNAIAIGDDYTISAGCDKQLATCKTKFNNVVNFRGFPHVPGQDMMVAGK
jgi:uncharacterized phage protein (TIGR02218 family)